MVVYRDIEELAKTVNASVIYTVPSSPQNTTNRRSTGPDALVPLIPRYLRMVALMVRRLPRPREPRPKPRMKLVMMN